MKDSAVKWLYAVPGGKRLYIVLLAAAQAIHGASGVLYALLLRNIVDAASAKNGPAFWQGMALIVLLVAGQLGLRTLIRFLTELSKATLENRFKARLLDVLLKKEYMRISALHSAEWMNRLTNDTVVVANGYVDILPGLVGMVVKLISALVMIVVME